VRATLKQFNVYYPCVDIARGPEGRQRVGEINRGYRSVPTPVFHDASTSTEPTTAELKASLGEYGYESGTTGRTTLAQRILGHPIVLLAAGPDLVAGVMLAGLWLLGLGAIVLVQGLLVRWLQRGRSTSPGDKHSSSANTSF
jgi:hypothetical protein